MNEITQQMFKQSNLSEQCLLKTVLSKMENGNPNQRESEFISEQLPIKTSLVWNTRSLVIHWFELEMSTFIQISENFQCHD